MSKTTEINDRDFEEAIKYLDAHAIPEFKSGGNDLTRVVQTDRDTLRAVGEHYKSLNINNHVQEEKNGHHTITFLHIELEG